MQLFYVRAPQQYVAPSGVGTIKLTYSPNQAQPSATIQYASTTPKVTTTILHRTKTTQQIPLLNIEKGGVKVI